MAAGYEIASKDPLATFLTKLSRSPLVRKTTRSGVYELDLEAPDRLRARLEQLDEHLRSSRSTHGDEARASRERTITEMRRTERLLEEIARTMPDPSSVRRAA